MYKQSCSSDVLPFRAQWNTAATFCAKVWCHCAQAVALGAAVHAGILEGSVADVMVLDIWQASLLRALAKQQLRDAAASLDEAAAEPPSIGSAADGAECDDAEDDIVESASVSADREVLNGSGSHDRQAAELKAEAEQRTEWQERT